MQSVLPLLNVVANYASLDVSRVQAIRGLAELCSVLRVTKEVSTVLLEGLESIGAIDVSELSVADWEALDVWSLLLPLPRRRLLQHTAAK